VLICTLQYFWSDSNIIFDYSANVSLDILGYSFHFTWARVSQLSLCTIHYIILLFYPYIYYLLSVNLACIMWISWKTVVSGTIWEPRGTYICFYLFSFWYTWYITHANKTTGRVEIYNWTTLVGIAFCWSALPCKKYTIIPAYFNSRYKY